MPTPIPRRRFLRAAALAAAGAAIAGPRTALAGLIRSVGQSCPLCGTWNQGLTMTGGRGGWRRLDGRFTSPYTRDPAELLVCDECGFVLTGDRFTEAELAERWRVVTRAEYQRLRGVHGPWYLLAMEKRGLGMEHREVAHCCLRAAWQAESTIRERGDRQHYLRETTRFLRSWLQGRPHYQREDRHQIDLVGETLRQQARFEEAWKTFEPMRMVPAVASDPHWLAYVEYELDLIDAGDAHPRKLTPIWG